MYTRVLSQYGTKRIFNNLKSACLIHCNFCGTKTTGNDNKSSSLGEFTPIYKFPYIRVIGTVTRLKNYHSFVTCAAIPSSIILNQLNLLSSDGILVTCSLGLSGCMVLYSLSYLTRNFIGFLYVNKAGTLIKVSYIDYWGRRKDEIVDTQDIVPLSDLPFAFTDGMYFKLRRFSRNDYWKFNIRLGTILDQEKFKEIFK